MSVQGTNLAAAVAATAFNAQQVSRTQDKRARETHRDARKLRDTYDTHLKVLEEHDEGEAAPRLVVDDQLQERHRPQPTDEQAGEPKKRLDVKG